MARDYSRTEVLDIVEQEAKERGIPRDDFMRFAYIETGGTFNEQASRGPNGAKGLFQFVPDTADDYNIRGRELDAVANTDAAAQLYLDNRTTLVNRHGRDGQPYLSGKAEPDGLDMYMAHQQGAGGYRSIQTAIATGHFGSGGTRANILNNVSSRDFETVTGGKYADFSKMSDKDMATTFTQYWDVKFDRVRIPEKGIEPVTDQVRTQPTPTSTPSAATSQAPGAAAQGISLSAAHDLSVKFDDVTYKMGAKHPERGTVDCSGWVGTMQNATMAEINEKAGREVFGAKDRFNLGFDGAAMIVEKAQARSGVMIEGKAVTRDVLKEGMIIGEDNGAKSWDAGRYKGIDHITMVVRDPKNGELMISQSRGSEGVELSSLDKYLEYKQSHGVKLFATDPLAKSRELLQDRQHGQSPVDQTERQPTSDRGSREGAPVAPAAAGLLRFDDRGPQVIALQESLNRLGYSGRDGQPLETRSGIYGEDTKHAVQALQRAHGVGVDGVVGRDTRGALAGAIASPLMSEASHPNHRMFSEIARQLPPGTRPEVAANVTLQAMENGITSPDRLAGVAVRDGNVFVGGSLAGERVRVDLNAPTPTMQQMSDHTRQQSQQPAQPDPARTQDPVQTSDTEVLRPRTMTA